MMKGCIFSTFLLLLSVSILGMGCSTLPAEDDSTEEFRTAEGSEPQAEQQAESQVEQQADFQIFYRTDELPPMEETPEEGEILFFTQPAGAEVLINGKLLGKAPFVQPLEDGSYHIRIKKVRHKEFSFYLDIQNDDIAAVQIALTPLTGKISPIIKPRDTKVTIGNKVIQNFPKELPVGTYTIHARRFGYEDKVLEVKVQHNKTIQPRIELEARPFTIKELSVSPKRIQITPPLETKGLKISGSVSAPGTITIRIFDTKRGLYNTEQLRVLDFPQFEKKYDLPPGSYEVKIEGTSKDKKTRQRIIRKVEVVPSDPVPLFTTTLPTSISTVGVPRARSTITGLFQSSFTLSAGGEATSPSYFPTSLSFSAGLPYCSEVQASAGLLVKKNQSSIVTISSQVKKEFFSIGKNTEFSGAFHLFGNYLSEKNISENLKSVFPLATFVGSGPIMTFTLHPHTKTFSGLSFTPNIVWQPDTDAGRTWTGIFFGGIFFQHRGNSIAINAGTHTELKNFSYTLEYGRLIPHTSMHLNFSVGALSSKTEPFSHYTSGIAFYYIR